MANKILALDCATHACSVALSIDGDSQQLLRVKPRAHNRILLPMMDRLLKHAKLKPKDIDLLVCGIGPGSFMGVRIAVAAAQGLATATNIPIIAISSLDSLAQQAYHNKSIHQADKGILALLDARLNQVYWACYVARQGQLETLVPPSLSAPQQIKAPIDIGCAIGDGWIYKEQLPTALQSLESIDPDGMPQARHLIELATSRNYPVIQDIHQLSPLYLRHHTAGRF